jgi:hypothetical protein
LRAVDVLERVDDALLLREYKIAVFACQLDD